jgi:hypothetical protein
MIQTFLHMFYGPKLPRNAAYTSRTTTDLELLIYKENQAYIKNKYFWEL